MKDKMTGVKLIKLPEIDMNVIAAMLLLIGMAWGVARMERAFVKAPVVLPVFTVPCEISVMPVVQPLTKKDAKKIGEFMSLGKAAGVSRARTAAVADTADRLVLSEPASSATSITAPRILYKTIPDYPVKAIEQGVEGTVVIKAYILKNGRVGQALVDQTSGREVLDRSALYSVSQWVFEPAVSSRQATESWFKVPVRFSLK